MSASQTKRTLGFNLLKYSVTTTLLTIIFLLITGVLFIVYRITNGKMRKNHVGYLILVVLMLLITMMALKGVLSHHFRSVISFCLIFMAQFVLCFVTEIYPKLNFLMIFHLATLVLCFVYAHKLSRSTNEVQYEMVSQVNEEKEKIMGNNADDETY